MSLRRAIYQSLVALPFLGIGLLMIHARTFKVHFEPVRYDTELHNTILAYSGPVSYVDAVMHGYAEFEDEMLDKAVALWKNEYREGRLRDYLPRHTAEMTQSSVRDEIRSTKMHLVNGLTFRAASKVEREQYADATYDYLDALEIAAIGKYSDFITLEHSARTQSRILELLLELEPHLAGPTRGEVLQRLLHLRLQQRNPTDIMRAIRNSEVGIAKRVYGEEAAQEVLDAFTELLQIQGIDELSEYVRDPRAISNTQVQNLAILLKSAVRSEIVYRDRLAELAASVSLSRDYD